MSENRGIDVDWRSGAPDVVKLPAAFPGDGAACGVCRCAACLRGIGRWVGRNARGSGGGES